MIQRYILSVFCILLLSGLAYIPINSIAQEIIREDLTGIWKGPDQSTYYVRHLHPNYPYAFGGKDIMWVGLSADDGKTWANVFVGKIAGNTISGTWADMPRGKLAGSGTLTLELSQLGTNIIIKQIGSTGSGFGTSYMGKPSCPSLPRGFFMCGWATNIDWKSAPPGGPPLQPPLELGKK